MSELYRAAIHAYEQLVHPNLACAPGAENKPLLTMLDEAIRGKTGTEGSGQHGYGLTLNHNAVELETEISLTLLEWSREYGLPLHAPIEYRLGKAINHTHGRYLKHQLNRHTYETRMHRIPEWVERILNLYEGHRPTPSGGSCTKCKKRWSYQNDTRKEAVIIYVHPDKEPYAQCVECGYQLTAEEAKNLLQT